MNLLRNLALLGLLPALALLLAPGCPRISDAPDGLGTENYPPVAVAFAAGGSDVGVTVTLDGSRSYDPNLEDELTYAWTIDSVPSGSAPALSGADTTSASFTPTVLGRHLATLTVSDGTYRSQATVSVIVGDGGGGTNQAPVAVITGDTTFQLGAAGLPLAVALSAGASADPDGDPLTFTWSMPGASTDISVRDASASDATFDVVAFGSYPVLLEVSDGALSTTATVTLVLTETADQPPTASISGPTNVEIGNLATFSSAASSDPEGQTLSFTWSLSAVPAGSSVTVADPTVTDLGLTPDVAGTYEVQLIVNDGTQDSAPATASLLATDPAVNNPPVAAISSVALVQPGTLVDLDGSGSLDPDGDAITYLWAIDSAPAGSTATLSSSTTSTSTFTPDLSGDYTVSLTVDDGEFSDTDTWTVTADAAPTATIGNLPPSVPVGTNVSLDGSGSSDPEGQPLTYAWTLVGPPSSGAALTPNATAPQPAFVADAAGTYVVRLTVNDGTFDSSVAVLTLVATASTGANSAPIANAGPDQTGVPAGTEVQLDGSLSSDPDLDPLLYFWSLVSMPAGVQRPWLDEYNIERPTALIYDEGTYVWALVVDDGRLSSPVDTVSITAVNLPPVADAGGDFFAEVGTLVSLEGGLSFDANEDELFFTWTLVSVPAGSSAALIGASTLQPAFVADLAGDYVFELIVSDGFLFSAPDQITVTASADAPIADAGLVQGVTPGTVVTLDGSGSVDPRPLPGPLTFAWTAMEWPEGDAPVLNGAGTASPTFLASYYGTYRFLLVVTNELGMASAPAMVEITARRPPTVDLGPDFLTLLGAWGYYPNLGDNIDSSVTSDYSARPLSFTFEMVQAPAGSALLGATSGSSSWTVRADLPGTYRARITVTDIFGGTATDEVSFIAEEPVLTVVGGDAQTGTVGENLPVPLRVALSSASGLQGSSGEELTFTSPGQPPLIFDTDAGGVAIAGQLPLGTVAGPQTLQVHLTDWPSATTTATATGTAGAATAIVFDPPTDTSVDGTMLLTGRVIDAYNNPVTTSSLPGTLTCDGSATFGALTVGTEVGRAGPQEVDFQAAGGLFAIEVTDTVAGLVNFDFVDSQGLGIPAFGPRILLDTDFEANDGGFVEASANWTDTSPVDDFAWGEPTFGPAAAHSGTRLWGTNLDGSHGLVNESVREIKIDLRQVPPLGNVATLSAWHWEDFHNSMCPSGPFEQWDAGGIAFVAKDEDGGDDDWEDLLVPIGGAPYDGAQEIDGVSWPYDRTVSGWLCSSGGWRQSSFDLSAYAGQIVDIQFVFIFQTSLFAPLGPGFYFDDVRIDALGTGTTGRFLPGAAVTVTPSVPAPAPTGGLLRVDLELEDQFGSVASADSTSTFTVSASGSATFVSAIAGTILSGEGTSTAQVQASSGRVSLFVTDAVRESVTFTLSAPTPATLDVTGTATGYFTGVPQAICVRAGDAQTGTVGSVLPVQLQVQVIDEADCLSATAFGVKDDILFVPTPSDDSLLMPLLTSTDALGFARTTATLPIFPGAMTVDANSQSNPALTVTFTATAQVGPPTSVFVRQPASNQVGANTTVTAEVRDALGNVVTTDNTTTFRLRTEGTAIFGSLLTGTPVSGLGNAIEVQAAGGLVEVELTSSVPGRFAIWTEDSQGTGMAMAPHGYEGRIFDHPYANDVAPTSTLTFTGVPAGVSGEGTLEIRTDADIDDGYEWWDLYLEGAPNPIGLGPIFEGYIYTCWPEYQRESVVVPAAALTAAAADGLVEIDLVATDVAPDHGAYCGSDMQMLDASLRIPGAIAYFENNSTCLSARSIGRGTFSMRGTTGGAADTFSVSCTNFAEPGGDVVHSFTPTGTGRARISVNPLDGQNLDWSLTTDCATPANGCLRNERYDAAGLPEEYQGSAVNVVAGMTYYLIVDSPDSSSGEFELSIELPQ